MPKINDVTGHIFNKLTVIERIGKWKNTRQSNWLCLCECGKTTESRSTDLISGHKQSCGCLVGEKCMKRNKKNDNHDQRVLNKQFITYQKGAEKRNLRFALQIEQFDYLTQQHCYYCNKPPKIPSSKNFRNLNLTIPRIGIDRVFNLFGYIQDNVVPCCFMCNQMKLALETETFFNQIRKIYEHHKLSK